MSADIPLEIESKFEVAAEKDLAALEQAFQSLGDAGLVRDRSYETVIRYYDTPSFDLDGAGVYLRAMDACPPYFKAEVCVKTRGNLDADGTLTREEHGFDSEKNGLNLDVLSEDAQKLVAPARDKTLSEIFNTVTRRHDMVKSFNVAGKKIAIDLALDHVDFIDADTGETLRSALEVEIEYKAHFSDPGISNAEAAACVAAIRHELAQHAGLTPISESRAETGYRLHRETRNPLK